MRAANCALDKIENIALRKQRKNMNMIHVDSV